MSATPTPWKVVDKYPRGPLVCDESGVSLATVSNYASEWPDNANLIVLAVNAFIPLVEALKTTPCAFRYADEPDCGRCDREEALRLAGAIE